MKLAAVLCAASMVLAAPRRRRDPVAIKAEAAYRAEHWDEAAEGFEQAYENDPQLDYLFAWAQSERKRGACARAVELYDAYLLLAEDADVPEKSVQLVRDARAECDGYTEPPPPVMPEAVETAPIFESPPDDEDDASPRPWHRDPLGATFVGVGLGALVAGGVVVRVAQVQSRDARSASNEEAFQADFDRSRTVGAWGLGLIWTGAALAVVGGIRWAVLARKQSKR